MKKLLSAFVVASSLVLATPALANSDPTLYEQLGGKDSIRTVMDDFVQRLKMDTRIGDQFKHTNADRLAGLLTEQVCEATGGPCKYTGRDMKSSHVGMTITKAHFNALVEVLVDSMSAAGVPFALQTDVLALLAPMHRDVITVR